LIAIVEYSGAPCYDAFAKPPPRRWRRMVDPEPKVPMAGAYVMSDVPAFRESRE
jgi:hypothetical protein